jgi:hypothetical protein
MELDTTYLYAALNRRRRAYQRERVLKKVCPWLIAAASFGTLGYLIVTKVF